MLSWIVSLPSVIYPSLFRFLSQPVLCLWPGPECTSHCSDPEIYSTQAEFGNHESKPLQLSQYLWAEILKADARISGKISIGVH